MRNTRIFIWMGILLLAALLAGCVKKDEVG